MEKGSKKRKDLLNMSASSNRSTTASSAGRKSSNRASSSTLDGSQSIDGKSTTPTQNNATDVLQAVTVNEPLQ